MSKFEWEIKKMNKTKTVTLLYVSVLFYSNGLF